MRGWIAVPALAFALGATAVAQHGGGHAAGAHGGFAGRSGGGGHSGGMRSGGMRSGGMRSGGGAISRGFSPSHQSFSHAPSFHQRGFSRSRGIGGGSRGFGNCLGCRRFGRGRPYWGYGGLGYPGFYDPYFYDPYWWWDSGSSQDEERDRQLALADQMDQESLAEQSAREVQDKDLFADNASYPREPDQPATGSFLPATVLVFNNQTRREVRNYAIVGVTLWNFSGQRIERIPLADLDLEATAEINEDRGIEFRLPVASQGQ